MEAPLEKPLLFLKILEEIKVQFLFMDEITNTTDYR